MITKKIITRLNEQDITLNSFFALFSNIFYIFFLCEKIMAKKCDVHIWQFFDDMIRNQVQFLNFGTRPAFKKIK